MASNLIFFFSKSPLLEGNVFLALVLKHGNGKAFIVSSIFVPFDIITQLLFAHCKTSVRILNKSYSHQVGIWGNWLKNWLKSMRT